MERISIDKVRFFRVERTYAVKTGKWYFEFEAVTGGDMRVGWARPGCKPDVELGTDAHAFVFDGYRVHLNSFTPSEGLVLLFFITFFFFFYSVQRVTVCTRAAVCSGAAGMQGTWWDA